MKKLLAQIRGDEVAEALVHGVLLGMGGRDTRPTFDQEQWLMLIVADYRRQHGRETELDTALLATAALTEVQS